jgi:hypothetical protein
VYAQYTKWSKNILAIGINEQRETSIDSIFIYGGRLHDGKKSVQTVPR